MNLITKAKNFALVAHRGQKRKNGEDYFKHVERVAERVSGDYFSLFCQSALTEWTAPKIRESVIAAAYLHDTIEDCDITKQILKKEFNVMIAEIVKILSRRKSETYFDFIMRIRESGAFSAGATAIKLADLQDNLSDLEEGSRKDKYRFANYILTYLWPKTL